MAEQEQDDGQEEHKSQEKQSGNSHLIRCGNRKQIRNECQADRVTRSVEQYPGDATPLRVVHYPCLDDADKDTAQHKEDKVHRVEYAHLAGDEECGQMPDRPEYTQDHC
jgi:hypothetical protein